MIRRLLDVYTYDDVNDRLGKGGFGYVYKGRHERLNLDVVLKKVYIDRGVQKNRLEVDVLKHLTHQYLPKVYDYFVDTERRFDPKTGQPQDAFVYYTVMDYIPGKSFEELYKENCQFEMTDLLKYSIQLCQALEYLHSQKPAIIHCDIKPGNIMLKPDGNVCLIDFNIAFYAGVSKIAGYTKKYSSPEQFEMSRSKGYGPNLITPRSDLFSLAATLFVIATGSRDFSVDKKIDWELLENKTSKAYCEVIKRAMNLNPDHRFASATDMKNAFKKVLKQDKHYKRMMRIRIAKIIGLAACISAAIAGAGFFVHLAKVKKNNAYNYIVEDMIQAINAGTYDQIDPLYQDAVDLFPGNIEAPYRKACALYAQGEYQTCNEFIEYDILSNEFIDKEDPRMMDVYHIKGNAYFEQKMYEEAVEAYRHSVSKSTDQPIYFLNLAVALAYTGDYNSSDKFIDMALELDPSKDILLYARGEIYKSQNDFGQASNAFRESIEYSKDDELKTKTYKSWNDMYEQNDELLDQIDVLQEAIKHLPEKYHLHFLEELSDTSNKVAQMRSKNDRDAYKYLIISADASAKLIEEGYGDINTYKNAAMSYINAKSFDKANQILSEMLQVYDQDYTVYKMFAFLEYAKQAELRTDSRSYTDFNRYYKKAVGMCEASFGSIDSDDEMLSLERYHRELIQKNYLQD